MTNDEVKAMCRRMEVPFDEEHPDHISTTNLQEIEPPFMEYVLTDKPVYADGVRYLDIRELAVILYSDTETCDAEEQVKAVLDAEDLRWKVSREFIEELLMWNIVYRMEV